jgi:hypothetical protein
MKIDFKHLFSMLLLWLISIYLVFYFSSCSAKWHINRAYKKGAKLEQTSDTIRITSIDSFKVVLNDTFYFEKYFTTKDTIIQYKRLYVPKTRFETRIEYKLKRDTLRLEKVKIRKEYRTKTKPFPFTLLLIVIGLICITIISFIFKPKIL